MYNTVEEDATSRFFAWKTSENYEIEQIGGASRWTLKKRLKLENFLKIGINYLLMILKYF
jgi:hypothetical protein